MGNSRKKHSRFENWKLVSEKIFANDKSFNLFSCETKNLLENVREWPAKHEL